MPIERESRFRGGVPYPSGGNTGGAAASSGQGMTEPLDLDPAAEADLVALADDCLPACRRTELEARVAGDPVLASALARQRGAIALLAAGSPCPTAALRARLANLRPSSRGSSGYRASRAAALLTALRQRLPR